MNEYNNISILIAEDNDISRELMASILKTQGFDIVLARNGNEAIDLIREKIPDLALVDLNMEPKGGFEFIRYLKAYEIDLPVVIVTADDSSDILTIANELGVSRILQKPVEPDRLINITKNILKRYGHTVSFFSPEVIDNRYTKDQLMQRAIDIAERNAKTKKGGPFGAVVTNDDGIVLGEGSNGITSRVDPTAHAEVMAIRQAAEKLGRSNLSDCILYCSSEPTMMGKALIISVGIKQVYFGLSHTDISEIRKTEEKVRSELVNESNPSETKYIQHGFDDAMIMFKRWQKMEDKLSD